MDSAHAELLASEAWRNICDTSFFVCVVAGVTAGCSCRWEAGPLCPTASPRRLSEWVARLVRLPEYFTVALQVTAHLYGRISAVMLDSFWVRCLVFLGVSYSFQLRYYLLFLVQISLHHSVRFRLFEYLRRRFLGVLTLGDC